ncbi:cupredoxin domain-containing protein [Halovenus salina]|uniref:Cupredoxin domain-containing protein n=1 Tax=Halovenus salina TaxID=1510225 RepID=A0ABD5VY18_9EURY
MLAGIGVAAIGSGFASATVAGQEETVTVTLDNVGISAWEVTGVEGADDVGPTGEENPQLTLQEGVRYTFVNNGGGSHPLAFRASDGETLLSQSDDGSFEGDSETDWVDDGGSVSFTLTSELADEMATYVCTVHGSMTGSIETTQAGPAATVTFSDQSSTGTSVVVDAVELTDGGFVTIHNSNLLDGDAVGSVIGVSEYLGSGSYENVTVELDTPLVEGETLVAMPHRDTDGDEEYTFVESEGGADGPYVVEGDAVIDDADVQVDGAAAVQMSDQMTRGETVIVDFARLDDGGFVTIHDSTLLDGDPLGSVVGVSSYFDGGTYENLNISLDETLTGDDTLIAMPHRDTDGDGEYTFVESEGGADGPYTFDGGAVTNAADVTVLGDATVTISDQETDGTSVVVDSAELDDGGFVTIHDSSLLDGDALGSVVGVSEYLEPGSYEDLEVVFNEELTEDDTLIAMPHRDTNGNQTYDFVEEEGGADGPYFQDGAAVTAQAEVTVLGDATVSFSDQETDGMAVIVDSAELRTAAS